MEPITMKFLHVIEQNDICNLLLKKMDINNRNTGLLLFRKIIIITTYSSWLINLYHSNTIAKWLNYFGNIDNFWCDMQFSVFNKISSFEKQLFFNPPGALWSFFWNVLAYVNFKEQEHFNIRPIICNYWSK